MEQIDLNTRPLHTLSGFEATNRLRQVVKQAYFRRSRQIPANIDDIVETLKGDIIRVMPAVTVNQIDEAVTDWVLNQIDKPLSPAFFFAAIRSKYEGPRRTREMDRDTYTRPDTEEDILSWWDMMAIFIDKRQFWFDMRKKYQQLVDANQLNEDTWERYKEKAATEINTQRVREGKWRKLDLTIKDDDLEAACKRMAVEDWLRSCKTANVTPSKILRK